MSKGKLCILYVSHSAQLYGAEQSLLQLLKGLDRDRFSPVVVLPGAGRLQQRIAELSIPVEIVSFIRPWLTRKAGVMRLVNHIGLVPFLAQSVWTLRKLIHHYRIDLVHTNSITIIDGALAARSMGVAHIWHAREILIRGSPYHFLFGQIGHNLALSIINHLSDRIIGISNAVCQSLEQSHNSSKAIVVYNAIDIDSFDISRSRTRIRQSLGVPDGVYLVGEIAKVAPVKGYTEFVQAAAQVRQAMPNVAFIGVGDALPKSYFRQLSDLIAHLRLHNEFTLLGFRDDVPDIISALDLLVLPSHYEPFGRALVEAMAAGKPVVGTRVGGIPEIIESGITGLLVTPGSPDELAQAMIKILQDPDLARRMGAAGRERARTRFSPGRYVTEIQKIYEELVRERTTP
jgi:glycosyltransferase involved in cell wall biosynthesis